jgi:hypothetical protein
MTRCGTGVCVLLWLGSAAAFADEIRGIVTSATGAPLEGALVSSLPWDHTKTDAEGRFLLQRPRTLARFSAPGYRPVTKTVADLPTTIALEALGEPAWTPPLCGRPVQKNDLDIDTAMRFALPKGAKVRRGHDIDYVCASVHHRGGLLSWGAGPHWSAGLPVESEFRSVVAPAERDVKTPWDDVTAAEYRGTRADGTRWRFIGLFGQTIEYEAKTAAAAEYFDRILDSLCWTHP